MQFGILQIPFTMWTNCYLCISLSDTPTWSEETHPRGLITDSGHVCSGQEATLCLNGGSCYRLPAINSLSCVCRNMYTGSRCETLSLFASSQSGQNYGLIAAVVIVALLIAVAVAVFIYYIIKFRQIRKKKQQNSDQQGPYWKVASRA